LAEASEQLMTMGILEDSMITFSQMLEWAQPLDGIKDHSNTPAETTNAYDADYKKRCVIRGANFQRSKRLKWLHDRLVNLNVDLELARNEASHERATALEIEIDVMKADTNVLESQTAEQHVAAYALRDRERDRKRAAKELAEEARRAEKEAEDEAKSVAKAERDRKRAAEKAEEEAQRAAKVVERDARWTPVVDAEIERMIDEGYSYDKIASKLGNGLKMHDIKNRWNRHLNKLSSIIKPAVQTGFPSSITWTADVDTTIVRMRADDVSFAKIASKLGNGLKRSDIKNRWNRHLKDKRSE
jgi:flagellar biosynthesis GTPase FlhF